MSKAKLKAFDKSAATGSIMTMVSSTLDGKISKLSLNEGALRFKNNIELELKRTQTSAPKIRYECVYKKFLRDIRMYYSQRFELFLSTVDCPKKQDLRYKYILFPYLIL